MCSQNLADARESLPVAQEILIEDPGVKMKVWKKLGWGVAMGLVAAACSSSGTPASSGTSGTGTTSGGSSGAGTGASSGTSAGMSSGGGSGATSVSGAASGSTSGATGASGAATEAGAGTLEAGGDDAPSSADAADALCAAKETAQGNATPFTPGDFCALFESICSKYVIGTAGLSTPLLCLSTYATWTSTGDAGSDTYGQQGCRSLHLCNAAMSVAAETPHCYHAQGYIDGTNPGGPCP
jgi:hypothetical protein